MNTTLSARGRLTEAVDMIAQMVDAPIELKAAADGLSVKLLFHAATSTLGDLLAQAGATVALDSVGPSHLGGPADTRSLMGSFPGGLGFMARATPHGSAHRVEMSVYAAACDQGSPTPAFALCDQLFGEGPDGLDPLIAYLGHRHDALNPASQHQLLQRLAFFLADRLRGPTP